MSNVKCHSATNLAVRTDGSTQLHHNIFSLYSTLSTMIDLVGQQPKTHSLPPFRPSFDLFHIPLSSSPPFNLPISFRSPGRSKIISARLQLVRMHPRRGNERTSLQSDSSEPRLSLLAWFRIYGHQLDINSIH